MDTNLRGQCFLITGASGGIGLATARLFAEEGARLVLHYRSQERPLREYLDATKADAVALQADLREQAEVERLFSAALKKHPRIDGLIANAGIFPEQPVPLHAMSLEQWQNTISADLDSTFLTCRAFLRHVAETPRESASIVLVGSTSALFGEEGHADYSAAKAAMTYGLTRTLKNEIVRLAPRGRVNCVCPGWTRTPMAEYGLRDAAAVQRVQATMALRKIATAEDVAAAIAYLASDRLAGHLSGTILPVAGGMEGRLLHSPAL